MKPQLTMVTILAVVALAACGSEQVRGNEEAINRIRKELKDQSGALEKIRKANEGTKSSVDGLRSALNGVKGSIDGLREEIGTQRTSIEEVRTDQAKALDDRRQVVDEDFKALRKQMEGLEERVRLEGVELEGDTKKQLEALDAGLGDVGERLGKVEAVLGPEGKEVARSAHLHTGLTNRIAALEAGGGTAPTAARGSDLPPGLTAGTSAYVAIGSFFLAVLAIILILARTGKTTRRTNRLEKELEDLATAQRMQSRVTEQTTKKLASITGDEASMKESQDALKKILESDENRLQHIFNIGTSFEELGAFRIAKEWFDSCVKIDGEFTNGWIEKGICLAHMGNHREADICIERALKQSPNHPRAWYNKACIAARLENEDEMYNAISKAVSFDASAKQRFRKDKDFEKYWGRTEFTTRTT